MDARTTHHKRQRKNNTLACNPCRSRKVGCHGDPPTCSPCRQRDIDCTWAIHLHHGESRHEAKKRSAMEAEESVRDVAASLDALRFATDAHILHVIRNASTSSNPVRSFGLLAQKPDKSASHADSVADDADQLTRKHAEQELLLSSPESYATLIPMEASALPLKALSNRLPPTRRFSSTPSTPAVPPAVDDTQQYCDVRLHDLRISEWTQADIRNEDAAFLISRYLEIDHPLLGFFDPELFMADLVTAQTRFCSQLLVNALLAYTCRTHSASHPHLRPLSHLIFEDSRRLWLAEMSNDSICTIAASHVLALYCVCDDESRLVSEFNEGGFCMAERMGIFSSLHVTFETTGDEILSAKLRRAAAHTAWGAYNWLVLHSQLCHNDPPDSPPSLPIPGVLPRDRAKIYLPDLSVHRLPPFMAQTFPELCKLRYITHEIFATYNPHLRASAPIADAVSTLFVIRKYHELLDWASDLADVAKRRKAARPHVVILHIWYHAALMDLFRPFIGQEFALISSTSITQTAKTIYTASLEQLKAMVVSYRHQHATDTNSILWHIGLLYVGNSVLQKTYTKSDRSFYFQLCIDSYTDLSASYTVATGFLQALVRQAVEENVIEESETNAIMHNLRKVSNQGRQGTGSLRSADFFLAMTSRRSSLVKYSIDRLRETARSDEPMAVEKKDRATMQPVDIQKS